MKDSIIQKLMKYSWTKQTTKGKELSRTPLFCVLEPFAGTVGRIATEQCDCNSQEKQ